MKYKLLVTLCALSLMGWIHAQEAASDPAAAQIGETTYPSREAAIAAAQPSDTVTLLQVVLEKGDCTAAETYSVANPVFDERGEYRVVLPWSAMTQGTNAIQVKVVK